MNVPCWGLLSVWSLVDGLIRLPYVPRGPTGPINGWPRRANSAEDRFLLVVESYWNDGLTDSESHRPGIRAAPLFAFAAARPAATVGLTRAPPWRRQDGR